MEEDINLRTLIQGQLLLVVVLVTLCGCWCAAKRRLKDKNNVDQPKSHKTSQLSKDLHTKPISPQEIVATGSTASDRADVSRKPSSSSTMRPKRRLDDKTPQARINAMKSGAHGHHDSSSDTKNSDDTIEWTNTCTAAKKKKKCRSVKFFKKGKKPDYDDDYFESFKKPKPKVADEDVLSFSSESTAINNLSSTPSLAAGKGAPTQPHEPTVLPKTMAAKETPKTPPKAAHTASDEAPPNKEKSKREAEKSGGKEKKPRASKTDSLHTCKRTKRNR